MVTSKGQSIMVSRIWKISVGAAMCALTTLALAQAYPSRPIRMVVSYGPGTGIDVVARLLAQSLETAVGWKFVVDNRTGASGTVAAGFVAGALPDGYTLLFDSSSNTSAPALMQGLPYDPARDLVAVTTLVENPLVLVASPSRGYKTVRDLVAAGKAKPGSLTFGSGGFGTSTHISAEKFRMSAGFSTLHVPFKSTPEVMIEILAGRMDFTYASLTAALGHIREGRLVALAMSSRRSPVLPGVPTIVEAGYADSGYSSWLGVMAPAKTPKDIINRLYQETVKAMATADLQERLAKVGMEPATIPPDEFDALRRRELVENKQLISTVGKQ